MENLNLMTDDMLVGLYSDGDGKAFEIRKPL